MAKEVNVEWESTYQSGHLKFTAPYQFAAIEIIYSVAVTHKYCQKTARIGDDHKLVFFGSPDKELIREFVNNAFKEGA